MGGVAEWGGVGAAPLEPVRRGGTGTDVTFDGAQFIQRFPLQRITYDPRYKPDWLDG